MSYRDELSAAFARIAVLERELAAVSQERDRLLAAAKDRAKEEAKRPRHGRRGRSPRSPSTSDALTTSSSAASMTVYCKACGGENDAGRGRCVLCDEPLDSVLTDGKVLRCPVCSSRKEGALDSVSLGALNDLRSCRLCGGFWVSSSSLEKLLEAAGRQLLGFNPHDLDMFWEGRAALQERSAYLFCPECGRTMLRRAHSGSKVVLDICVKHGIWCDHGELPKLIEAAARGDADNPLAIAKANKIHGAGLLGGVDSDPVLDWLESLIDW